jgi:hypothetical protein
MRKIVSLLPVLLLLCLTASTQTMAIKGQVKDSNGNPIPFASVLEAGTRNGTSADANGSFSLRIKQNGKLSISAAGF